MHEWGKEKVRFEHRNGTLNPPANGYRRLLTKSRQSERQVGSQWAKGLEESKEEIVPHLRILAGEGVYIHGSTDYELGKEIKQKRPIM